MEIRKPTIVSVAFSVILLVSLSGVVFGSSTNWIEVVRFTGVRTNSYSTNEFICNHSEWRIIWEYIPNSQDSNLTVFAVFAYPIKQGFRGPTYLDSIIRYGAEDTKGVSYIQDYQGTFTLNINAVETENFSIIIEQNIDTIPEFPSWTILEVGIFLVSVLSITCRGRKEERK